MDITRADSPRLRRFLARPFHEKSRSIYARWKRIFPSAPFPIRLPFGAWLIGRDDLLARSLTFDSFEAAECASIQKLLRPGMIVLDIGAHQGFYTLFASSLVGKKGRVFAFEPSPRERRALRLNIVINFRRNVSIQPLALGDQESEADLHIVSKYNTGCNSLRPPAVPESTFTETVKVGTLDNWLAREKIDRVDFMKIDVEGAELSVLKGAHESLMRRPRPIIQAEVEDVRTKPWGYRAQEIVAFLNALEYEWFQPELDGRLAPIAPEREEVPANLVAVPTERKQEVLSKTN